MADLLICQTFFRQMLKKRQFAKLSPAKLSRYMVSYAFHIFEYFQPVIHFIV